MQILSKNFNLPIDIKSANKHQVTAPSFKASKTKLAESLATEISKGMNIENKALKDIFSNPKKKKMFFEVLGSAIIATVANLVNSLSKDEKESIIAVSQNLKEDKSSTPTKELPNENTIKFNVLRGVTPQIEKDFIKYIQDNFTNDKITSDRLKLLFNKFGGSNRKNLHIHNDSTLKSNEILTIILEDLKSANGEKEKIDAIVNRYQNIQSYQKNDIKNVSVSKAKGEVLSSEASEDTKEKQIENFTVDISEEIQEILDRYPNIKKVHNSILATSTTQEEAEKRIELVNNLVHPDIKDLHKETLKKARQALNKNYVDSIEDLSKILTIIKDYEKNYFYGNLANKLISKEAVTTYVNDKQNQKILFNQYNNLIAANIDKNSISKLAELICCGKINSLNINSQNKDFKITLPSINSLNRNFETIMKAFSLIKNENVNLNADDNIVYDKDILIEVLKKDFDLHGKTTYKNIVKYLYGNKHEVKSKRAFDKHQMDYRFNLLIDALNDDKLFNPKLFSNHSKLRFIERFVLNQDFGDKKLSHAIKSNMRVFIESIKNAFIEGIQVSTYSNEYVNGIQLRIPTDEFGLVVVTLNDDKKFHTIF